MTIEPRRLATAAETAIAERFAARPTGGPAALAARREDAYRAFERTGLPSRRVEAYRYTDLKAALRTLAPAPTGVAAAALSAPWDFAGLARHRIVFVDGRYAAALSDVSQLDGAVSVATFGSLIAAGDARAEAAGALVDRFPTPSADPIVQLNTALFDDGALITVAPGSTITEPVAIVHVVTKAEPVSVHTRHVVTVAEGATVRFIEHHVGPEGVAYQSDSLVELDIADGAKVVWVRLQEEGEAAIHLGGSAVRLGGKARLDSLSVVFGAQLSRNQGFVTFAGPHSEAVFETVSLLDGRRQADATLVVTHAVPDCISRERFRAVIDDAARSVVQGRIEVAKDAQHTDGRMMTQALIIGEEAESINKPELEIFADDVQCAHGATSGRLDDNAVFYLRSRGIPRHEAEALLLEAFLAESIEAFADEAIAEVLSERLRARLAQRRAREAVR